MIHFLWHIWMDITGANNEPGSTYGFWSGFGGSIPDFLIIGSLITLYMHHNCHVKGCPRIGHIDPKNNHPACKRHHSMRHKLGRHE